MNKNRDIANSSTSSIKAQKTVASSVTTSSTSTSYKYSETAKINSISNYGGKVNNNDYNTKYIITTDANKIRSPINKTTTGTTTKRILPSSYTPVYQPNGRLYNNSEITQTSINRPPAYPSTSTRNVNMYKEVFGSMPKQNAKLAPNKSEGLFYSFDAKQPTPKQSVTVPAAIITASAFSNPSTRFSQLIDQPKPPPSLLVDKPNVKQSFFSNLLSSSRKRGYALILNHYTYENDYQSKREGTQYDVDKLKLVFDYYNIETYVKTDLKLNQITNEVNILKTKNFSKYECFIIVILTHGKRNDVLCAHDKSYNFIKEIEDPLLLENKSLLEKPKIFVIQACRGVDDMPVIEMDSVLISPSRQSAAVKRNILKLNATYEGYVSFRNTQHGTIFIQTLCQKLKEIGKYSSIYNVMMKVIDEVSNNIEIPQVPTVQSSMINHFCFGSLLK